MAIYTIETLKPETKMLLDELEKKGALKIRRAKNDRRPAKKNRLDFYLSGPVMSDEEYENYTNAREWMNRPGFVNPYRLFSQDQERKVGLFQACIRT